MTKQCAQIVIGRELIAVLSTGEVIEIVRAAEEKLTRVEGWPIQQLPATRDIEPWQNKRRTPWRKRK